MAKYTIGIDYGTNSCRSIVADCSNGEVIGVGVYAYAGGTDGVICDAADHNLARQDPAEYVKGLRACVEAALKKTEEKLPDFRRSDVIGIGMDGTGSSPLPVDAHNTPLAMLPQFKGNPNAMCWLWKDHTSFREAAQITALAEKIRPQYLEKCGGAYSWEWFWSKIFHCLNTDEKVFDAAHSWVELSDFIPALLCGAKRPEDIVRGVCMAGHKAMYCEEWGGLPDNEYLAELSPKLSALRDRLFEKAHDASRPAGALCAEWAQAFGLREGMPVAMGEIDVHYGAIGCGIREGTLVKAIGTSTCDCIVFGAEKRVPHIRGICGIVNGSILPAHQAIEAGQSAVGDIFKWFAQTLCLREVSDIAILDAEALKLRPGQSGLIALDWNNGNRNILANPLLTGLLLGQTLHTTQAETYRALVEATAFGARMIIERIKENGVEISRIICCGGLAEKSRLLMQTYADVTGCEMELAASDQACALGAAVSAAVCAGKDAGGYADFFSAMDNMTGVKKEKFAPIKENAETYEKLFAIYKRLHDAFGGVSKTADLSAVMPELIAIKQKAVEA